jgi:hypothetical protein
VCSSFSSSVGSSSPVRLAPPNLGVAGEWPSSARCSATHLPTGSPS